MNTSPSFRVGSARRRAFRGLSIIELMIGVAIGLAIVAGGARMLADGLVGNRRTLIEARISQDLRSATDIIARDLRRAGHWRNSLDGVTGTPVRSEYRVVNHTVSSVEFNYAQDPNNALENNEYFGFRLAADGGVGLIQMQDGRDVWQPLTDPRSVDITAFEVLAVTEEVSLGSMCGVRGSSICCSRHASNPGLCKQEYVQRNTDGSYSPVNGVMPPAGTSPEDNCPQLIVRRYEITVRGRALPPNDLIRREIRETVRVRNDEVTQVTCP